MQIQPIALNEYQARRAKVLQQIGPDAVALVFAAKVAYRSGHSEYAYRQDSDFYYLTGFNESDAVLILAPGTASPVILFNQKQDKTKELWTGARIGQEATIKEYGVDAAYPIEEIDAHLPKILANKKIIYYPFGHEAPDKQVLTWITKAQEITYHMPLPDLAAIQKITAGMRLIKSPAEINLMHMAADISAKAHHHAMASVQSGMMEYQLAAEYIYQFTQQGALDVAYLPIVGGGENACVLHYTANKSVLRDGDLVLVDAGCEYQNYCADVSRTFPVNGKFTPTQRAVYSVVLNSYLAGLEKMKPGSNWPNVLKRVVEVLTEGLLELGLLKGKLQDLIAQDACKRFFMHGPGHWLGLDVHDVGVYKIQDKPTTFESGMVLTLEPGIYIGKDETVDKKWWHTGIRIEDDILITEKGYQVLSSAAPIQIDDIEQLMR
jgi:Xaa-Pro aminopeptidase